MPAPVVRSEELGFWILPSQMFAVNQATVELHLSHGFRQVGLRKKIGKMTYGPDAGQCRDALFFERRSVVVGIYRKPDLRDFVAFGMGFFKNDSV